MLVEAAARTPRHKIATSKLLELLYVHHGADVPRPLPSSKNWFWMIDEPDPIIRVEDIKRVVCAHFGITKEDLMSDRRLHRCVRPRHVGMYLARCMAEKSWPEIARRFGKSDHSTARCAFEKIERLIKTDWKVAYDVALIWEKLA